MPERQLLPSDHRRRVDAVRERLEARPMLLSHATNIRWLTGFGGSLGWVVIDHRRLVLITDGRYRDRACAELQATGVDADLEVRTDRTQLADAVVQLANDISGGRTVLAEADHVSHAAWTKLAEKVAIEPAGGIIEELRRVKDTGELARISLAASIADGTVLDIVPMLFDQPTEADVRDELEYQMRRNGADAPSYDAIVASGPQLAARPHHATSHRTIVEGDTVIIDVGALVDGYHSDMTRTFVVGEPDARQREIYGLVRTAQAAGLAAVAPGTKAADVDAACRSVFREAGYEDWYLHNTGHGVGLDVHEEPFCHPAATTALVEGDVVTVEPGLYRDGFGGVRLEDLVAVTASGGESLTTLPKDDPCPPSRPTT